MPSGAAVAGVALSGAKKSVFRPDIQGLRMVAVLAVIADHLFDWPSGGFVGVDVFFVISGFLITGLLLREHERTGTFSFSGFYRRRVKRIIPAAMTVIVTTLITAWFLFNQPRFWATFWDALYATFFTANWRFAAVGTDYFQAEAAVSPLQHYWSLSVEEQFYFVWPWLMLLIFIATAKLTPWTHGTARTIAGVVMLLITVASFVWSLAETASNPTWAYFSTFSRTWELGLGALIAVFAAAFSRIPALVRPVLGWVGLLGIIAAMFVVSADVAFPAPWALLPVLSTAAVIIAGTGGEQRYLWPLTNRGSRYIGDISYSLYVWHWPIIVFGTMLWGDDSLVLLGLLVAIAFVSVYSYHFIEDPIRRSSWLEPRDRRARRRGSRHERRPEVPRKHQTGVLILVATLALAASASALLRPDREVSASQPRDPDTLFAEESPGPMETTANPEIDALSDQISLALSATSYPDDISPTMDEAISGPQAPADVSDCGQAGRLVDKQACTWGDPATTNRAVIVGDSVSMTWVNPLRNALPAGWSLTSLGTFGCAFTDFVDSGAKATDCVGRRADAVRYINETHPQVVIIANSYWLNGLNGAEKAPTGQELAADYTALLTKFDTSESRVVFLAAPPSTENPNTCYTPVSSPADCVSNVSQHWQEHAAAEQQVASAVAGAWVDSRPLFCADGRCPVFVETTPVRRDLTHMTPAYGEKIIPALRETVSALPPFAASAP